MEKTIRELTGDLLAAPSACKEIKDAAQNYLDAVGTKKKQTQPKHTLQRWKRILCLSRD